MLTHYALRTLRHEAALGDLPQARAPGTVSFTHTLRVVPRGVKRTMRNFLLRPRRAPRTTHRRDAPSRHHPTPTSEVLVSTVIRLIGQYLFWTNHFYHAVQSLFNSLMRNTGEWLTHRSAWVRGITGARRHSPIDRYVEPRRLGILGEPRVNVSRLNVALDSAFTIRTNGAS